MISYWIASRDEFVVLGGDQCAFCGRRGPGVQLEFVDAELDAGAVRLQGDGWACFRCVPLLRSRNFRGLGARSARHARSKGVKQDLAVEEALARWIGEHVARIGGGG